MKDSVTFVVFRNKVFLVMSSFSLPWRKLLCLVGIRPLSSISTSSKTENKETKIIRRQQSIEECWKSRAWLVLSCPNSLVSLKGFSKTGRVLETGAEDRCWGAVTWGTNRQNRKAPLASCFSHLPVPAAPPIDRTHDGAGRRDRCVWQTAEQHPASCGKLGSDSVTA